MNYKILFLIIFTLSLHAYDKNITYNFNLNSEISNYLNEMNIADKQRALLFKHYNSAGISENTIEDAKSLFDDNKQYIEAIEIFLKYPNDGEVQYYLGKAYYYGMGVEKDTKKAFEYAKKSAKNNNPSGLDLLGVMHLYGNGTEKDVDQALKYFKKAANLGSSKAMLNIGNMYVYGIAGQKDFKQAESWYLKAVKSKNKDALGSLGDLYWYDLKDNVKALKYYLQIDNSKYISPYMYEHIALIYKEMGKIDKSYDYLVKAINNEKYEFASYLYEYVFEYGLIEKKDEALKYLNIAAENNDTNSILKLSEHYYYINREYSKAIKVLQKAYDNSNNLQAGCTLAMLKSNLYDSNVNFPKPIATYDIDSAFNTIDEIIKKYPKHKDISLCYNTLSEMYTKGNYTIQDYSKSINILKDILDKYPYHKNTYLNEISELEQKIKFNSSHDRFTDENNKIFSLVNAFEKQQQVVSVLESKDYFFLSVNDKSIKMYEKNSLKFIKEFRSKIDNGVNGMFMQMAFDEQNKLLYASVLDSDSDFTKNDFIRVFDINTAKVVRTIDNKQAMKNTYLNISSDGKYLVAINNEQLVNIIDTSTNEIQHYQLNEEGHFIKAKIEHKNSDYLIHILSKNNQLYTFSLNKKRRRKKEPYFSQITFKTFDFKKANKIFNNFQPNDISQLMLKKNSIFIEGSKNNIKLSLDTLKTSEHNQQIERKFNKTDIVVTLRYENRVLEINNEYPKEDSLISLLYVKALKWKILDNKYILVVTSDISQMLIFTLDGHPIANLQGFNALQTNIIYDKKQLLSYGSDNIVHIYDLSNLSSSENEERKYSQEKLKSFGSLFHTDKPLEFIQKLDESFISYMIQTGQFKFGFIPTIKQVKNYFDTFLLEKQEIKPIVSLYIKNEKDWIMHTPEGLFTYGGEGHKLLKYHQNQGLYKEAKIIENEKLYDKFYRPDLIKKILAGEKVNVPIDVKLVILNIKPPELKILAHKMVSKKDIDLTYRVCDAGDGISDTKLLINGKAINPPTSRGFSKVKAIDDKCKV